MSSYKQVAFKAAKQAGQIISKYYDNLKPGDIKKKSAHDIVTKADMAANRAIKKLIKNNFPDHDILSEETGLEDNPSDYFWTIDPLDGTTNFSIKNPLHCAAISLSKKNDTILSVIYAPAIDEFYYAEKGKGAYLNGKRIRVSKNNKARDAVVLLGRTHHEKSRLMFIKLQNKIRKQVMNIRWQGSGSLDLAFTATGRVGACIFTPPELTKWDLWPGILLVKEAGGKVTNFQGQDSIYYSHGMVAGNKIIVNQLQKSLKKWK